MLGNMFKPEISEKLKKQMEKKRELIIKRAAAMRKLTLDPNSGWREYVELLEDYVSSCAKRKAVTALDNADEKTLYQLKLLDHEIWLIKTFILKIPEKMINLEETSKQENEDD